MTTNVAPRRPPRRRRLLWLVSLVVVMASLWAASHAGTALVVSCDVTPPDAIVTLASHEWERLPSTAAVARQFPSSIVLLTVPQTVTKWNCHQCAERPKLLQAAGIAAERIVELAGDPAANTYGEALATRRYATTTPIRRLMVVTSPYHSRRALNVFRHVFTGMAVEVGVLPASASSVANPSRWWWHGYDRAYVPYEWAALLQYRVEYGVPLTYTVQSRIPLNR